VVAFLFLLKHSTNGINPGPDLSCLHNSIKIARRPVLFRRSGSPVTHTQAAQLKEEANKNIISSWALPGTLICYRILNQPYRHPCWVRELSAVIHR